MSRSGSLWSLTLPWNHGKVRMQGFSPPEIGPVVPTTSRLQSVPKTVQKFALLIFLAVTASQAALSQAVRAVSGFAPQKRLGYRNGDQWEPAMAADAHGHIYVLYPQYGA